MPTLSDVSVLVTSVLSNFICDACTGDDLTNAAYKEITEHVEVLHQFSVANPSTRIVIAPPLPRSVPDWFQAYLPGFSSFLYHEVVRIGSAHVKFLSPFVAPLSYFEADGVHLNNDAGTAFITHLISGADHLFPAEPVPVIEAENSTSTAGPSSGALAKLSLSVSALRDDVVRRRLQDNLLFARIKEDRDFEINKSREDRCTLSGLRLSTAPPSDPPARKEFFKKFVTDLVNEACPLADPRPVVLDVLVNMRPGRGPPYFEVKFDSVASSVLFRTSAAKLAKDDVGSFSGVFVSNTVNQSTRIRIDIMKLIAKRLTTPTELCYVQGFSSRPTLHYRVKDDAVADPPAPGTGRSYTFTECVERWGHLLSRQSLEAIRRKASQSFHMCLEQYFVVLKDRPAPETNEDDLFSRIAPTRSGPPSRPFSRGVRSLRRGRGTPFPRSSNDVRVDLPPVSPSAPVDPHSAASEVLALPVTGAKRSADTTDDSAPRKK